MLVPKLWFIGMGVAVRMTVVEASFADSLAWTTSTAHSKMQASVLQNIVKHVKKQLLHFQTSCSSQAQQGHSNIVWKGNVILVSQDDSTHQVDWSRVDVNALFSVADAPAADHDVNFKAVFARLPGHFCRGDGRNYGRGAVDSDIVENHDDLLPIQRIFNPRVGGNAFGSTAEAVSGVLKEFRKQVAHMGFNSVSVACVHNHKCTQTGYTGVSDESTSCPHIIIRARWSVASTRPSGPNVPYAIEM